MIWLPDIPSFSKKILNFYLSFTLFIFLIFTNAHAIEAIEATKTFEATEVSEAAT